MGPLYASLDLSCDLRAFCDIPTCPSRSFPPRRRHGLAGDAFALSRRSTTNWFAHYGLAGTYVPLAIEPDGLEAALRALAPLALLRLQPDHPAQGTSARDRRCGRSGRAAHRRHQLRRRRAGRVAGRNEQRRLRLRAQHPAAAAGWRADAGPIVVIGAGGGARAVVYSLAERGAREIRVINRTFARAEALAREFGPPVAAIPWEERHRALDGTSMLVNTTSQGMVGQPPLDLALDALPVGALVCDIVYVPLETPLLAAARRRGNPHGRRAGHAAPPGASGVAGVVRPRARGHARAPCARRGVDSEIDRSNRSNRSDRSRSPRT